MALGKLDEDLTATGSFSTGNRQQTTLNLSSFRDTYTDGAGTHHSLYAKATIKGVEMDTTVDPAAAYHTEYIKFVEWDDNAELEKVELQYKLGGFEYTTQAYKTVDTTTGGDYVVYLPNVVESVHDLIATAMSTYANVNSPMAATPPSRTATSPTTARRPGKSWRWTA